MPLSFPPFSSETGSTLGGGAEQPLDRGRLAVAVVVGHCDMAPPALKPISVGVGDSNKQVFAANQLFKSNEVHVGGYCIFIFLFMRAYSFRIHGVLYCAFWCARSLNRSSRYQALSL